MAETDLPKLIVFDLDFTLWSTGGVWIDCTTWPFTERDGRIFDADEREFKLYPDVEEILQQLLSSQTPLALASRTSQPDWARWVLETWDLRGIFQFEEIYPGSKTAHFESLRRQTGHAFEDMLFFDDEARNIDEVGQLGVTAELVKNGVDRASFERGLAHWRSSQT
ncbi:MAG: magnesium-dependent phosphatase 1 [Verrucomicrobiales bacterium]|jgi:magnesium-dependent phosphatase 1